MNLHLHMVNSSMQGFRWSWSKTLTERYKRVIQRCASTGAQPERSKPGCHRQPHKREGEMKDLEGIWRQQQKFIKNYLVIAIVKSENYQREQENLFQKVKWDRRSQPVHCWRCKSKFNESGPSPKWRVTEWGWDLYKCAKISSH